MYDNSSVQGQYESKKEEVRKGGEEQEVRMWDDSINLADKEEENWREDASKVDEVFRDEKERKSRRYNILYANTETLIPALYNSIPVPDVRPRYNSANPTAKVSARILEKVISHCVDEYDFSAEMEACVQDMALPGRGVARVRYDPSIGPDGYSVYHRTLVEHVPWPDFRRGPAKLWRDVPWIAFRHFLTREQLDGLNPALSRKVNLDASVTGYQRDEKHDAPPREIFLRATVWEIWDKESREVLFYAPSYKRAFLRREADPLNLTGFYPVPRPLYAIKTTTSLVPIPLYKQYEDQAEELDRITRRITSLVNVLKWRGLYAGSEESSGAMSKLADAEDGDLIPATDFFSVVVQGGGLDNAIWLMPIDRLVLVIEQLYKQREQIKQVIFEITGVADIMRGASDPNETLGAQKLKTQWGSLRVQRQQAEIQRFVRDLFRMKAEIVAEKYDAQALSMITEEQITPDIEQLLRMDVLRSYRIDVETDSTIKADLTRDQENMTNFLNGTAQYIAAVAPAVQGGQMPQDVAAEIFASFARTFKLGKQAEDALEKMSVQAQQPQPQKPDPEQQKAEMEMQKMQMDMQIHQQKSQTDMEATAAKNQMDQQRSQAELQAQDQKNQMELAMKQQEMQMKMQIAQAELQIKMAELDLRREEMQLKRQEMQSQAALGAMQRQSEMVQTEQKHDLDMQMMEEKSSLQSEMMEEKAAFQKRQMADREAQAKEKTSAE